MAKLTRTNFEGFARMAAELQPEMPNGTSEVQAAKFAQWQRMMHYLMNELHDQSGLTPMGNRSFDAIRFLDRVNKLTGVA